jgi:hypothetical protein
MDERAAARRRRIGSVTGNLSEALMALFGSIAVGIVALVTFRDGLRARLCETWPVGIPVFTDAARMIAITLRPNGRWIVLYPGAEPERLGADARWDRATAVRRPDREAPAEATVRGAVASVMGGVLA